MRTSRSTTYGLLAAGYIAQHKHKGIILSQTIAKQYNIPLEYLLKIMQQLVRAQILRSKRGPRGGFSMAKALNKVTMLDIIEAVEGPMDASLGMGETAPRDKFGNKTEQAYGKVIAQARNALKKVKLSDLV
ncbi:MAG: RrF2 family transcriptional regulator [Planctomycetota bacterium]|jgi:Rrf2 family protein